MLMAQSNSTCPIHRLSKETLATVFEHVYYNTHKQRKVTGYFLRDYTCWTTKPLWVLGGVCQKWRRVTQTACPQLWAHICTIAEFEDGSGISPDPPSVFEQQLEFAKGSLLDITVRFEPRDETSPFSVLYKLSPRWRRATIVFGKEGGGDYIQLSKPMQLNAPALRFLKLDFAQGTYVDTKEDTELFPFDITAPKLREVEVSGGLGGVTAPPIELPWNQLTHVSLAFDDMREVLKYVALIKDSVESLSVIDATGHDSIGCWPSHWPMPDPTNFPKLRVLELRSGEDCPGEYEPLLNMLIAPELRSLTLCGEDWPYGRKLARALQRSQCKLEDFIMIGDWQKNLPVLLPHTPHLLSLGLNSGYGDVDPNGILHQLVRGPDPSRTLCPLFKQLHKSQSSNPYQPRIFDPPAPRLAWKFDESMQVVEVDLDSGSESDSDVEVDSDGGFESGGDSE